MQEILSAPSATEANWNELRPVLDEAMHELDERDREAILLRYFEGCAFAEVGAACGLNENSARMRVERAVEKLRARLARRGITSTAAALGATLAAQPTVAAPAGMALTVADAGLHGLAIASHSASGLMLGRIFSAQKLAATGLVVLVGCGFYPIASARLERRIAAEEEQQNLTLAGLRSANALLSRETQAMMRGQTLRAAGPAVDPLDRLRAVAALIKEGSLGTVRWTGYGNSSEVITPVVSDLFALNSVESHALAKCVERTKREISTLAIAHATVRRNGNEIVVEVTTSPEARESYNRMLGEFRKILGPERFTLHQEVGFAARLEQWLNNLGLDDSTLRFSHDAAPRMPEYPYSHSRERVRAGGGGGGGGGGGTDLAGLKRNLGPFAVFVPDDF